MSPEQWDGLVLDGRCDVYALGVILFQMLTAQCPYEGTTPSSIMRKHLMNPVPNILSFRQDLPPTIQPIIEQAMAKKRDNRYPRASALSQALQPLVTDSPVPATERLPHHSTSSTYHTASPPPPPPPLSRQPKSQAFPNDPTRKWLLGGLGILGVTLLSLLIIIAVNLSSGNGNPPADAPAIAEASPEVIEAPLAPLPPSETPLPTKPLCPPQKRLYPPLRRLCPYPQRHPNPPTPQHPNPPTHQHPNPPTHPPLAPPLPSALRKSRKKMA